MKTTRHTKTVFTYYSWAMLSQLHKRAGFESKMQKKNGKNFKMQVKKSLEKSDKNALTSDYKFTVFTQQIKKK